MSVYKTDLAECNFCKKRFEITSLYWVTYQRTQKTMVACPDCKKKYAASENSSSGRKL